SSSRRRFVSNPNGIPAGTVYRATGRAWYHQWIPESTHMQMPVLETARLEIRPFTMADLEEIHRLLDWELAEAETGSEGAKTLADRERWLRWTVLAYEELAALYQPPYGDRAMSLRGTGELIGACGYVPCLNAFGQIPALATGKDMVPGRTSTEL